VSDNGHNNKGADMLEELLKILPTIDVGTILVTGAMMWKMYSRIDKKFDAIIQRLDKIQETITDIDRRLCRLEGAFQSKECCLLKSDTQHKAAE